MTISFEEQFATVCPHGPSWFHPAFAKGNEDDECTDETDEFSLLHNSIKHAIDEFNYPSDFDGFKKSFIQGVHKWNTKNEQKMNDATSEGATTMTTYTDPNKVGKSLTMSVQLQGGFTMPISLEEIQEASSSQERLIVFQKINYLEDLLMDWKEICPLLRNDLSESFLVNPNLAISLINLHRKWFDQGRSSNEYTPLLFGICENLIYTLAGAVRFQKSQEMQGIIEAKQISVVSLVQNWSDMWLDLMQRDQYSEDLTEEMEKNLILLFLPPESCEISRIAQKALSSIDPNAVWFHSWANHLRSSDHLVSLLRGSESSTKILPELWMKIRNNQNDCEIKNSLLHLHSIAILSISLSKTRVSRFPWDTITKLSSSEDLEVNENGIEIYHRVIDEMLNLFLCVIDDSVFHRKSKMNDFPNPEFKRIILDGVDAILAGSSRDTNSTYAQRSKLIKSSF